MLKKKNMYLPQFQFVSNIELSDHLKSGGEGDKTSELEKSESVQSFQSAVLVCNDERTSPSLGCGNRSIRDQQNTISKSTSTPTADARAPSRLTSPLGNPDQSDHSRKPPNTTSLKKSPVGDPKDGNRVYVYIPKGGSANGTTNDNCAYAPVLQQLDPNTKFQKPELQPQCLHDHSIQRELDRILLKIGEEFDRQSRRGI